MSNRTDFFELARELTEEWTLSTEARERLETELHNAYVSGQENHGCGCRWCGSKYLIVTPEMYESLPELSKKEALALNHRKMDNDLYEVQAPVSLVFYKLGDDVRSKEIRMQSTYVSPRTYARYKEMIQEIVLGEGWPSVKIAEKARMACIREEAERAVGDDCVLFVLGPLNTDMGTSNGGAFRPTLRFAKVPRTQTLDNLVD